MKLYNTLTGTSEEFHVTKNTVLMYVCGVTPYSHSHLGHTMRAIVFDMIRRYLEFKGYQVKHVENFTDIDDKMIDVANKTGISTTELAEGYIKKYLSEMGHLNILPAEIYPRATQEIPKIQEIISGLVEKKFAYQVGCDVYFRVRSCPNYGKLSHRTLDSMREGSRVEINENKEDPMDFVLWKSQKPQEPAWESPWGPGRPGWHIECSAMALNYLGSTIDIHGGGQDLVFPHHENEIAQSESYTEHTPMSRFWVHNGLVRFGESKMSKSLGNVVSTQEALDDFSPDAIRLFFLSSHYRSPITYTKQGVKAQQRAVERLRYAANNRPQNLDSSKASLDSQEYTKKFISSMDDDFNTPRAISVLFVLSRSINKSAEDSMDIVDAQNTLRKLASILGLTLEEQTHSIQDEPGPLLELLSETSDNLSKINLGDTDSLIFDYLENIPKNILGNTSELIKLLLITRSDLRKTKQFQLADHIRDRLSNLGYSLDDTASGTQWKRREQ